MIRRAAALFTPLPSSLVAVLLACAIITHAAAPEGGAIDNHANAINTNENSAFEKLLESYTHDTTSTLHQKSIDHQNLQLKFDSKLADIEKVRESINAELNAVSLEEEEESMEELYEDMDYVGTKVVELTRRTESVLGRLADYNRLVLNGHRLLDEVGLEKRLEHVLKEELQRRDRYNATMIQDGMATDASSSGDDDDDTVSATEAEAEIQNDNALPTIPSPYISLTRLNDLLSPKSVITPSETLLQTSLSTLANQLVQQHLSNSHAMWNDRTSQITNRYETQYEALEQKLQNLSFGANNECLAISHAAKLVGKALLEHSNDGTNLVDVAKYETGASVVYELTSNSYVPPPRNDESPQSGGTRAVYEYEKQKMFDSQTRKMYHQQQSMLHQDANGKTALSHQFWDWVEKLNVWEGYTSFQFKALRPYLPQDWERVLDGLSEKLGNRLWSEYTARGAMDALVPDYVYHSLGMSNDVNFGRVFGRTVSPEVAISAGFSKSGVAGGGEGSGNEGGWMAKPMGHCYPLSMRPEDDPALSLLGEFHDNDASLVIGPKYTVRLPHAVYIDAVTLEHRSFPLPKGSLEHAKGGESAPRWVRVVGYPPCSINTEAEEEEEHDKCGERGFDLLRPIDLGYFEYQRITVTGREDDYGGSDDDEEEEGNDAFSNGRRRSIQTFAVKGGTYKPSSLFDEDTAQDVSSPGDEYDSADPRQCSEDSSSCQAPPLEEEPELEPEYSLPEPGQCAPPKDDHSEPSCGGDEATPATATSSSSTTTSSGAQRQVVEAVSFIIEENWGNSDYTCLYRVRVHGDAVQGE